MKRAFFIGVWACSVLLVSLGAMAQGAPTFHALSGAEANAFQVPGDMIQVRVFDLPADGLVYERYQQVYGAAQAAVLGGQITVLRNDQGASVYVVGAHYPNLTATNQVNITAAQARQRSVQDVGAAGIRYLSLRINPADGRYFFEVEARASDSRWVHWIDAGHGQIVNKFNALMDNSVGYGVQFTKDDTDVKDLTGLTTFSGGQFLLLSADGRQETHDQGSTNRPFLGPIASDEDDVWDLLGDVSPAQQALVDAHYYAKVTDLYYADIHAFDWVAHAEANGANTKMEVHAHYTKDYNNAFWNGSYIALGDGDGVSFEELTALDVVSHELTHGVTDFTSNLIYQNESGALNEAFSDIMGSTTEFFAEAQGLEPATTLEPDWFIGEDFDLRGDTVPGFRNMADPNEDGHPSHYEDRFTGTSDNGGVHINSGIANHWFYLLVNGGQNANPTRASGTDVAGIGLASAETIAFLGFTALPENATFCDARAATLAVAGSLETNVGDAWDEVGVTTALCGDGGGDTNSPPTADFTWTADGLTVTFTDASTDTDGAVSSWDWDFGDGNTSTEQHPVHTYANADTFTVTLTVTDGDGASDTVSKPVEVSSTDTAGDFSLDVTAYKVRGLQKADLVWSGATSEMVDVYRDGVLITTTPNDGAYTDDINLRGSGSYVYVVCEEGAAVCSNEATAVF